MCFENTIETKKCEELAAVFANMVEAVIVLDESGIISNFNQSAEQLLLLVNGKAKGKYFKEVILNTVLHYDDQRIYQNPP